MDVEKYIRARGLYKPTFGKEAVGALLFIQQMLLKEDESYDDFTGKKVILPRSLSGRGQVSSRPSSIIYNPANADSMGMVAGVRCPQGPLQ